MRQGLARGARLVWVVDPDLRLVLVHRPDGSRETLREGETIDGEDVLPGFELDPGALFELRPP